MSDDDDLAQDDEGPLPTVVVEVYKGRNIQDATAKFQQDAMALAESGYVPTSQSWAQGSWGCGAFLVALVLAFVLVGILIFIYMLLVKPEGTLTVTYELRGSGRRDRRRRR